MAIMKHTFAVLVCFLPLLSCHFFSMKFFRELIPSKRISDITVGKTEAPSVINCNLKCLNKKLCISTLFTISKKRCVLLKSFFDEIKEFAETAENNNAVKVIESRSKAPCSLLQCRRDEECLDDDTVGAVCKLGAKNLALNRPTQASSVFANRMPSLATNGIIEANYRHCYTSNKRSPSWWKVELNALAFIHTISVWVVRENFKVDIRAGTSNANMGESNPLCAQSVDLLDGQRTDVKCPDPTLGQVVSLITQQVTNFRLCEVEVHGVYASS